VISALQVEKHPTHMPGPNTPPPPRSFHTTALALSAFGTPPSSTALSRKGLQHLYGDHLTLNSSIHGSPIMRPQSSSSYYTSGYYGSPRFGDVMKNSPKPHSSPKMKLRLRQEANFYLTFMSFMFIIWFPSLWFSFVANYA
jgi:hypothetical protein